jgi:eukaryotic-like serine/threonine-protein kinase
MPLSPGTRLGPYEITGPLGAGGMGEVYRARDSRLNRDVAIKILPAAFADDAGRMARFQREAQVLAALNHPNIAAIYGLESSALVMELVEGQTLAERIAAGAIPLDEALAIARQIADALEAAHEKGIVHRDLKPANVKVTADDKVKVLDFGLAKAFENDAASGNAENSPTLTLESTRAGVIMGTAGYMSPEQARGKAVDKRADIWAFGVVLYEMLAGRFAFEGETVSDTLAAVLRADIDWARLPTNVPPKVRRLLQRCLERDVKKRLRDIGDAWAELDAPEEAVPAAARGRWWLPWAAAVAIGGAGIIWGLTRTPVAEPRPVSRWQYTRPGYFIFPALSRDGTQLAFTDMGEFKGLSVRMMAQMDTKLLPDSKCAWYPEFSPDGQWIAFLAWSVSEIKKIPIGGGAPITLATKAVFGSLDWGENDEIVFSGATGLMGVAAAGGQARSLTTIDSKKGETHHESPRFLPGGGAIVFTIATGELPYVAVLDLKTGVRRMLVKDASNARYIPTGHLLYLHGSTLFAAPFNPRRMEFTGPEAPVIENVSKTGAGFAQYSVSDSGLLVYKKGRSSNSVLGWADQKGAVERFSAAEPWGVGRLSPDGRRIAAKFGDGKQADIYIYEVDRRTKTRLTFEGTNNAPIWTPDGRRVTFHGMIAGKHGIYSALTDGSGKAELLLATEDWPAPNSWSPDGKTLVYEMADHLWVLPVENGVKPGTPRRLHDTAFYESDGEISPDGRWLAYSSNESGSLAVYVQPFPGPGGKVRISTEGGTTPLWSKNGHELFYWAAPKVNSVDLQMTPQIRVGMPVTLSTVSNGMLLDVSPDGKRFLFNLAPETEPDTTLDGVVNWFVELRRRVPVGK